MARADIVYRLLDQRFVQIFSDDYRLFDCINSVRQRHKDFPDRFIAGHIPGCEILDNLRKIEPDVHVFGNSRFRLADNSDRAGIGHGIIARPVQGIPVRHFIVKHHIVADGVFVRVIAFRRKCQCKQIV